MVDFMKHEGITHKQQQQQQETNGNQPSGSVVCQIHGKFALCNSMLLVDPPQTPALPDCAIMQGVASISGSVMTAPASL